MKRRYLTAYGSRGVRLRPAELSDQAIPCCVVRNDADCMSRAGFRIYPSCACGPDQGWNLLQVCSGHLPMAIRMASGICSGHMNADTVKVRAL